VVLLLLVPVKPAQAGTGLVLAVNDDGPGHRRRQPLVIAGAVVVSRRRLRG
jgi:hypothetical protein